jgi:CDP-diacylglycerol---glycerol-3-phosphate 3-phosphatidyltransferase
MNWIVPLPLGPLWLIALTIPVVFIAYGARVALLGRATDPRVQRERPTALLGSFPMEAGHWALRCVGAVVDTAGVSPDAVTWASLVLTFGTVPLAATGHFDWAALLLALGSACDAIDGIVARRRATCSDSGEVFDAVVDRYADAMPLVGLAVYYRQDVLALCVMLLTIIGCSLISYVRAKAESMQLDVPGGLMRRHERLVYIGLGLAVGPYIQVPFVSSARPITVIAVAFVGILANIAAALLTSKTRRMLAASGRGPRFSR